MALAARCCLNLSSPSPTPRSKTSTVSPSNTQSCPQLPWQEDEKWRRRCVISMACVVIVGLEMGTNHAIANENLPVLQFKTEKWSDKIRACPPWLNNSLETIVPENLPRPSAHRRWESVGLSNKKAPPVVVKVVSKTSKNCFSM